VVFEPRDRKTNCEEAASRVKFITAMTVVLTRVLLMLALKAGLVSWVHRTCIRWITAHDSTRCGWRKERFAEVRLSHGS
jgi:hypothetical protein